MADKRISQLVDRGTVANNDVVPIVVSGATTTNKATISSIQTFMQGNLDLGVTSVGITLGSSGTDVSVTGSPITSSGNITINLPTASATNRGLLSAADWVTFNSKQQAITLTTTGTSGAATLVSGTLNIPNYSTDLSGYVTLGTAQTITAQKTFTTSGSSDTMIISHGSGSGFALDVLKAGNGEAIRVTKSSGSGNAMTISGGNFEAGTIVKTGGTSSQFLKADGSVDSTAYTTNTGTVTSVGLSSATSGVTIGSTPITTSGTITLAIATASGSQNGLLSSTDWTTFNGKQNALTNPVTGTGVSGRVAIWDGTNSINSDAEFTYNSSTNLLTIGGGVTLTGAQTIQTSTGNLTLSTAAGNGNIILSAHGDGNVTTNDSIFIGSNSGIDHSGISNKLSVASTGYNLLDITKFSNDNFSGYFYIGKSRGSTVGDYTIVQNGDQLGSIIWQGSNGTSFSPAATISAEVDGVPGSSSDMPGRLIFATCSDNSTFAVERLRIASTGAATFSSSVTATSLFVNAGTGSNLRVISGGTNVLNVANYNDASGFREFLLAGSELSFYTGTAGGGSTTERMRITSGGFLLVGIDTNAGYGGAHRITRSITQSNAVLSIDGGSGGDFSTLFRSVSGGNFNSAEAAQWVGRNTSTLRSINAGGTVNASGTDYAEYMIKAVEDKIEKGDIVGINSEGELTNIFEDSISFVVKSTNPSYVGGDTWGNSDAIGKEPIKEEEQTDEEYQQLKDEFELKKEEARSKVDRIAFSGQVPCNILNSKVGDYIIPIKNEEGKISGQAVTKPSLEQYQISVGKVWKIMEDGRAWIAVKIG